MFRIVPDSLLRAERPEKVAEGEKIHRDPDRREPNGRRQKSGKRREPAGPDSPGAADDHGSHTGGDKTGEVGGQLDFEA